MAYDTEQLIDQAVVLIQAKKLIFVEDVAVQLGISKTTFYQHKLDEVDAIKEGLQKNKSDIKASLRSKWYKGEQPTLQVLLYKLCATADERKRMTIQYTDVTTDGESLNKRYDLEDLTEAELLVLKKLHDKGTAGPSTDSED